MYHCYLRGRQSELLAVRDTISKITEAQMTVIVEPVKKNKRDLLACVKCIRENNANFILIINPHVSDGELTNDEVAMDNIMTSVLEEYPDIILGLIIDQTTSSNQLNYFLNKYPDNKFTLIHAGEAPLDQQSIDFKFIIKNIFIDQMVSQSYINQFELVDKVKIFDPFNKKPTNAGYRPNVNELFMDIQRIMSDCNHNNYIGFGDYSIIGDYYKDGGGLPITVAIHLTYNDLVNNKTNIYIRHFLSEDRLHREDISQLIEEAFEDISGFIQQRPDILTWSSVCQNIVYKINNSESTNLPYLKRLSIKHHFELMHYLHQENYFISS